MKEKEDIRQVNVRLSLEDYETLRDMKRLLPIEVSFNQYCNYLLSQAAKAGRAKDGPQ